MKKLPYGISNYEKIINDNFYYVDKTEYIKKIENLNEQNIMYLRPRKFGKSLFTSTLGYYYDIKSKDKFEKLFKDTYIGRNPTKLKNSYYILNFDFSGIRTSTPAITMDGFNKKVAECVKDFVNEYQLDFIVNEEQPAEQMLKSLFTAFKYQKENQKVYVIIDEYDHFANELLSFDIENFKNLVSKNGDIRKWYEILKEGTKTVVDRIFITGVAPITLDSLTSGFNIISNITMDNDFNEMMGFTKDELIKIMEDQGISKESQKEIVPIMKDYYDGYKFSKKATQSVYNSNMCLFFLNEYKKQGEIPNELVDVNIASDYEKIGKMLNLCKGDRRIKIIEKSLTKEGIIKEINTSFNPAIQFTESDLVSMLFYLGYLTIVGDDSDFYKLVVPNNIMKEIYADYFLKILDNGENEVIEKDYLEMAMNIALEGKIDKLVELIHRYLNNLSNRDYQNFDEKYIKLMFYAVSMNFKVYKVKSELEINRKYPDLLLIPKDISKDYYSIMIEFKYLKKSEESLLEQKKQEAKKQIVEYSNFEGSKDIKKLKKYTIIAINDKLYVDEI